MLYYSGTQASSSFMGTLQLLSLPLPLLLSFLFHCSRHTCCKKLRLLFLLVIIAAVAVAVAADVALVIQRVVDFISVPGQVK